MMSGAVVALMVATPWSRSRAQQPPAAQSAPADHHWLKVAAGAGISLLTHESAHLLMSLALGANPRVGFDHGRPTVYSGIDSRRYPHKQFLFSAAGLTTQALLDEVILDIAHSRGGAVERGILAGGIGTTLFYITLGRNGSVSDIAFMSRTSSLSKTQLSFIFGGLSAIHTIRIVRDPGYDHFFLRPTRGGMVVGMSY